jgi:hypothetical protein
VTFGDLWVIVPDMGMGGNMDRERAEVFTSRDAAVAFAVNREQTYSWTVMLLSAWHKRDVERAVARAVRAEARYWRSEI